MAASTSDTAFLTLEKSIPYRAAREHWVNVYHFDQVPPDNAAWQALATQVWTYEAAFLDATVQYEKAYGHTPGTPPVLVYEGDVSPPGEGGLAGSWVPTASDFPPSGDVAAWIRYGTTQKSKTGKPIYLRNYYHGIWARGTHDTVSAGQKTGMDILGAALVAGVNISGVTYRRAGPRGAVAQNHVTGSYLTTRTLKHRGKRKRVTQAEVTKLQDALLHSLERSLLGPILGG